MLYVLRGWSTFLSLRVVLLAQPLVAEAGNDDGCQQPGDDEERAERGKDADDLIVRL